MNNLNIFIGIHSEFAYRRLLRIPSLTDYLQPFSQAIAEMAGEDSPVAQQVVPQIYTFLFYELLRFASPSRIAAAAQDMLSGCHGQTIASADPGLYRLLKQGKYRQVWLKNAAARLRHRLAVWVKYLKSFGGVQ